MRSRWSDVELDRLIDDVLVDAYGDGEQLGSFECAFADARLPVAAEVIGRGCSLESVEFAGDERCGLTAVVDVDGQRRRVGLVDVEIVDRPHEGARLLAAYQRWWVPAG